jgi:hypothetical protein
MLCDACGVMCVLHAVSIGHHAVKHAAICVCCVRRVVRCMRCAVGDA